MSTNLFTSISTTFNLDAEQIIEYQELSSLYTILTQIQTENRDETLLTEEEYEVIDAMADNGTGRGLTKARNIMQFFYGKQYPFGQKYLHISHE